MPITTRWQTSTCSPRNCAHRSRNWLRWRKHRVTGGGTSVPPSAHTVASEYGHDDPIELNPRDKISTTNGTLFLGTPRDPDIVPDEEAEDGLAWPQLALAGACVAIGLLPVLLVGPAAYAH